MKKRVWLKRFVALIVSFLLSVCVFCNTDNMAFAWLLTCYIWAFAFLACDYKKNIVMLAFLICFFVFLMGRPFVREVIGYYGYTAISLSNDTREFVYMCLLLSLASVVIGYLIGRWIKGKTHKRIDEQKNESFTESVKKISKFATIVLYSLVIVENFLGCVFVKNVGYTASFAMEYTYRLPYGLHMLVMMAPVALALFLATLPKKREAIVPIALFVISNILLVIAGHRFGIISCLLTLMIYFVWRTETDSKKWISGKQILCVVAMAPVVIVLMQYMTYWRDNAEINDRVDPIVSFMHGVGGSSDLIGVVKQYGDVATSDGVNYSFGGIWRSLHGNAFSELLGINSSYGKEQTAEYANNAHSLSSALTFYFYRDSYYAGYGLGGCYIAELYHDFSFAGVIIGNILVGIVIGLIKKLEKNRLLYNFLCIFLLALLFRIPRDSFDYPIMNMLSLKNMFIFAIMFLLAVRVNKIKCPNGSVLINEGK